MNFNRPDEKANLLGSLCEEIEKRLPTDRAKRLSEFVNLYYQPAHLTDLLEWKPEDLYGSTLDSWQFIQQRQRDKPKIRVFNPEHEQHGWQSTHSIVMVLQEDMPFLVDSVRMGLNRRNLTIYSIHSAVFTMKRDASGELVSILPKSSKAKHTHREALAFIEIDRHTDLSELKEMEISLQQVLNDVSLVVDDFNSMMSCCDNLFPLFAKQIKGFDKSYIKEVRDFIDWLKDNFTFLGYAEYNLVKQAGAAILEPVVDSQLGLLKSNKEKYSEQTEHYSRSVEQFISSPEIITFSKSNCTTRVHRPAYPDYISIKRYDSKGNITGEYRFLGLYTSSVYIQSSRQIPIIRRKVDAIIAKSGLHDYEYDWKELLQILEIHPRDDLFQVDVDELYEIVSGILQIHDRRQIRLFVRKDKFEQFYSCLVYSPREIYSTDFRSKVQAILCEQLGCEQAEFTTYFSESVLTRTEFILRGKNISSSFDLNKLEQQIRQAGRSWRDDLRDNLIDTLGEEAGNRAFSSYGEGFPAAYKTDFSARTAVADIQHIFQLNEEKPLQLSFYRALERKQSSINFKLFNLGDSLPLSDVIPVLENLGLRVIDEHPYRIKGKQQTIWIHDFNLQYTGVGDISLNTFKQVFEEAFLRIWTGDAANDDFNRLVLSGDMNWREVAMLRAYAAYMKQIRFPIGVEAISATLNTYIEIAIKLVRLFEARFEPDNSQVPDKIEQQIVSGLDEVSGLNDDRVIRQYLLLIKATLRTNFYQLDAENKLKSCFSFKLAPSLIPELPLPKPKFEIFVFSPWVEGVHLRIGKVSRGGLRWSDRMEDFRTEVLGLVKAQQVKNAVIVPVGAKGGFVAKLLNESMSREAWLEEGIRCYQTFISCLLDITDNLVEGKVVAPERVIRYDEDDTYLVVAADKGTATFSDIANEIANKYNFWLGDAFASGGSQGYDHKRMGITARGAWVSVERHFREMGINTNKDNFSVIGIGDMSGDVFGNGMLLSKHLKLVAAFNHMHIFIDPNPEPESSWNERARVFNLPRSSWSDYDTKLISKGGGIFLRSKKSITLTPEIQELTGLKKSSVPPNELISALLKSPVDMIWNGGIGTYVKSSNETDADVGDKANDALRINGNELNCKVIGEGGNLGFSQKARMEFALSGGRINTDFIDNAGGVDCSDHEVNIKILLDQIVSNGDMTEKQRNLLLEDMTDDIAELVLQNNYRQVQAISMAESRSFNNMAEYQRYILNMEAAGKLERQLEFLPDDDELNERRSAGIGLTRPELSVLISYSKSELKETISLSSVPHDSYLSRELFTAFPAQLVQKFSDQIKKHRLSGEIIGTQIANHMINMMGINFVDRLRVATGANEATIARAYILARDIFDIENLWSQIEQLDYKVETNIQIAMMHELQHLMRRATRWFVRNRRSELDCETEVNRFKAELLKILKKQEGLLCGMPLSSWNKTREHYQQAGVPARLAKLVAGARCLYASLGIVEVAEQIGRTTTKVAQTYFALGERLELDWLSQQINQLNIDNYWQAMAREAFRDDLEWQQRALVATALKDQTGTVKIDYIIDRWCENNQWLIERWQKVLNELKIAKKQEYVMYTVALRELLDLARSSQAQA